VNKAYFVSRRNYSNIRSKFEMLEEDYEKLSEVFSDFCSSMSAEASIKGRIWIKKDDPIYYDDCIVQMVD